MKINPAIFFNAACLLLGGALLLNSAQAEDNFYRADFWGNGILKIMPRSQTNPIIANWKSLIPEKYSSILPGSIPDELITEFYNKRDMFGNIELTFLEQAPEHLLEKHYYVISANGIQEVQIEQVEAVVRFSLDDKNNSDIGYIDYWGNLLPESDQNYQNGFALVSDEKIRFVSRPIDIIDGTVISLKRRGDIEIGPPSHEIETSFQFEYSNGEAKYVFIKFKPDPNASSTLSSCHTRIHLVIAGPEYITVNRNYSGCDI